MSLPQRLYYPLDKAAKELGCDVSDLIHFAANRKLKLCIRLHMQAEELNYEKECMPNLLVNEKELAKLIMKDNLDLCENEEEYKTPFIDGVVDFFYVTEYSNMYGSIDYSAEYNENKLKINNYNVYIHKIDGFFDVDIHDLYFYEEDIINGNVVSSRKFHLPIDFYDSEIDGYNNSYNNVFLNEVMVLSVIDKDSEELNDEGIRNTLNMKGECVDFTIDHLYVTKYEMDRIKRTPNENNKIKKPRDNISLLENPKSAAKIEDFITCLIKLIPEFKDVDLDSLTTQRIKLMLESISAEKGIEFNQIHPQTIGKYLGR